MLSDLTLQELEYAGEEIRNKVFKIPIEHQVAFEINDEEIKLA